MPRAEVWYAEGRAEYWEGRILEKQKKVKEATSWYQLAVRRYPLAVYALLAFGRLEQIAPQAAASLQKELQPRADGRARLVRGRRPAGKWARGCGGRWSLPAWGSDALAPRAGPPDRQDELAASPVLRDLTGTAALVLDRAGLWNASHSLVDDKLGQFRLLYPTGRALEPLAAGLPARLPRAGRGEQPGQRGAARAAARPHARGERVRPAGRVHRQLPRPDHAQALDREGPARQGGVPRAAAESPDQRGGRQPPSRLPAQRYRAVVPAIAAYNAGEGAVGRWLRDRGHLPVDEFLEEIPYEETRGYTKRVLASFFAYSWLYARKDRIPDVRLR